MKIRLLVASRPNAADFELNESITAKDALRGCSDADVATVGKYYDAVQSLYDECATSASAVLVTRSLDIEIYPVLLVLKKSQTEKSVAESILLKVRFRAESGQRSTPHFVDYHGRRYSTFAIFLKNNRLPRTYIAYPDEGTYDGVCEKSIVVEKTVECSFKRRALKLTYNTAYVDAGILDRTNHAF